jgi:hypothetical protein
MTTTDIREGLVTFLEELTGAMGIPLKAVIHESGDVYRIDLEGEGGELLISQRGEPLKALQHIVSTAFRRQLGEDRRVLVDCQHSTSAATRTASCTKWRSFWPTRRSGPVCRRKSGRSMPTSGGSSTWQSLRKARAPRASATPR